MKSAQRAGAARGWAIVVLTLGCVAAGSSAPGAPSPGTTRTTRSPFDAPAESAVWQLAAGTAPPPRSAHAMAFDEARGRTVLFGGTSGAGLLGDTWERDGATWGAACANAPCAASAPSPRSGHAMVYDRARGETVLFGGETAGAVQGDTWTWDGAAWSARCGEGSCGPPARFGHAMAYDSARARVVMFGGTSCSGATCADLGDTWEWDGSAWKLASSSGPARGGHAMTFDEARGVTVLFGGAHGGLLDDTWTWNGATWTQAQVAAPPPRRASAALAYDRARGAGTLFGGDGVPTTSWSWNGAAWTALSTPADPAARSSLAMVFDPVGRRVVLFGGYGDGHPLGDTWEEERIGGACALGDQCDTALCLDGACCGAPCGPCASCSAGVSGACEPVAGTDDPDSCTGDRTCDAQSLCLLKDGRPCGARTDCASGFCVDGVCCTTACTGRCSACAAALKGGGDDGTCGPAASGVDPHDDCADDGVCSCQRTGACDGAGACALYAEGADCAGCGGEDPAFLGACDGTGSCVPGTVVRCEGGHVLAFADGRRSDCAPYRCTPGATCLSTCVSGDDCSPGHVCSASRACVPGRAPSEPSAPGCQAGGHGSPGGSPWLAAGLAAALMRTRRRAPPTSSPSEPPGAARSP